MSSDKAIVIDTPSGIYFARLLALRGALRLEMLGLRHSREPSAASIIKDKYGLRRGCRNHVALQAIEREIAQLKAFREGRTHESALC